MSDDPELKEIDTGQGFEETVKQLIRENKEQLDKLAGEQDEQ